MGCLSIPHARGTLAPMYPPDSYTSRVYRHAAMFAADHPDYAAAAREVFRNVPGVGSLRFDAASVGRAKDGSISRIVVALHSRERAVWVEVRPEGDRLSGRVILDKADRRKDP